MARDNARPVPWWRWCARVLLAVCALAVLIVGVANVVTVAATRDRVVTVEGAASALASDPADAVVVLGASVYADGTPSDILADRLEVACDLYKSGAARAIIVSGDNRTSHYNESDAMKAYCVETINSAMRRIVLLRWSMLWISSLPSAILLRIYALSSGETAGSSSIFM